MHPSRFNIAIPSDNGEIHIYNTLTAGTGEVLDDWKEFFLNGGPAPTDKGDMVREMIEGGFIRPDGRESEEKDVQEWLKSKNDFNDSLYVVVVTSYACNLKCSYCYEAGVGRGEGMTADMSRMVVEWIRSRLEAVGYKKLMVSFYGGEPFLTPHILRFMMKSLSEEARARGIETDFDILTNGVYLDQGLITDLTRYGLNAVKVNLDGFGHFHDEKRPLKNGKGTFETIIANIKKIKGKITINIGGNFDKSNVEGIPPLLDYLVAEGLAEGIGHVHFKPILSRQNCAGSCRTNVIGAHEPGPFVADGAQGNSSTSWAPEAMLEIHDEARARGFRTKNPLERGPCEFYKAHAAAIDPSGRLYICGGFVGNELGEIGRIREYDHYLRRIGEFDTDGQTVSPTDGIGQKATSLPRYRKILLKDCGACAYLPLCGGGCRFSANPCQKDYYDTVGRAMIAREIQGSA